MFDRLEDDHAGPKGVSRLVPGRLDMETAAFWAQTACALYTPRDVEETLEAAARLALPTVAGADHAGVMVLRRNGLMETAAATDDVVRELDQAQADLDDGPGLAAVRGRDVVRVDDTAAEDRWPAFAAEARELGIRSLLSCPLSTAPGRTAALTLHAVRPAAFDASATGIAMAFARQVSGAVRNAEATEALHRSLRVRQVVGEATGMMMERYRLTPRRGLEMLVEASQDTNTRIHAVAEYVVATGDDPWRVNVRNHGGGRSH
jgi:GAF domain-containing protein